MTDRIGNRRILSSVEIGPRSLNSRAGYGYSSTLFWRAFNFSRFSLVRIPFLLKLDGVLFSRK